MRRWLGVLVVVLVVAAALAGCTSSDDGDEAGSTTSADAAAVGENDPTTEGTGNSVPSGDLPEGADTTLPVSLPPVEAQAAATPVRPGAEAAAETFNACSAEGSCREKDLVLVSWPGAKLPGIDLGFAKMTGVDLRGADLSGADLTGANLSGANLSGAHLDGADLSSVDLSGATMIGTSARGVVLSGATLFEAIIDGASFQNSIFCQTTWIDGRELNFLC
jgi:uncharacterized protein YceK